MRLFSLGLAIAALAFVSGDAIAAAAAWHFDTLADNLPIANNGCLMSFGLKGPNADKTLFYDDGTDDKAHANVKLNGKLFDLLLVSQKTSGKDGPDSSGVGAHYDRTFKDKTGAVTVASSVIVTAVHPDADSSELAGTLTVTYLGTTQKIVIDGGIAC